MTESINYEGVCRTAPATPGLLNTVITQGVVGQVVDVSIDLVQRLKEHNT